MNQELAVRASEEIELADETLHKISDLALALEDMDAQETHAAIIWAEAIAAAGKAQRAFKLAREASKLRVQAERRLGSLLNAITPQMIHDRMVRGEKGTMPLVEPKLEGAYRRLAEMPEPLFDETISDLLARGLSVNPNVVLRSAHHRSLRQMDTGVYMAWDGAYFIEAKYGHMRRARHDDLDEAREELYLRTRMTQSRRKEGIAAILDKAFAEARVNAQNLSQMRSQISGEANRLVGEAELLQAKVASLLFEAYRTVESEGAAPK